MGSNSRRLQTTRHLIPVSATIVHKLIPSVLRRVLTIPRHIIVDAIKHVEDFGLQLLSINTALCPIEARMSEAKFIVLTSQAPEAAGRIGRTAEQAVAWNS